MTTLEAMPDSIHPIHPLRIKICGQTRLGDALFSAQSGAHMIGVILFSGSKRHLPLDQASAWIRQLPPTVERVAVFVNPTVDEVMAALDQELFHTAQLHGSESPDFFAALNDRGLQGRLIKALRVRNEASIASLHEFPTRRFLLDGPEPGSGQPFDWQLAAEAVTRYPEASFLLAGGLTPENVATAIQSVHPHGVDVASGVETAPGHKDPDRLQQFINNARATRISSTAISKKASEKSTFGFWSFF
jgi:phosphoribosylanthranilate isomerase